MIWKIFLIFWEEAGRGTWNGGQGYRARKMEQEAKTRRQAKCDRFALIIGKITWKYAFFDLCGNIFFLKSCFCRSCRNSNSHKICFFLPCGNIFCRENAFLSYEYLHFLRLCFISGNLYLHFIRKRVGRTICKLKLIEKAFCQRICICIFSESGRG